MADKYWITGVWFNQNKPPRHITHVLTHYIGTDGFQTGKKQTEAEVIQMIRLGYTFTTLRWSYQEGKWMPGAEVSIERIGNMNYLRTKPDSSTIDNLDNMINMIGVL